MITEDLKIKKNDLLTISITSILSAILMYSLSFLNIDPYLKTIIIPLLILLCSAIFIIKKTRSEINKKAYLLLMPIGLIMLSNLLLNIDSSNEFLNVFVLPILMTMFSFSLTNKNYQITGKTFSWIFKLFPNKLFSNLKYNKELFKNIKSKNLVNILIGIGIGLPIVYILISLLKIADQYFTEFIKNIVNIIPLTPFNWLDDVIKIVLLFIVTFSIMINIIKNKNLKLEKKEYKPINNTISSTILIMVNFVFMIFLVSELSKLTVNFLHIPETYTHAEYAREGFFQLLMVTSINFTIIFYHIYLTKGIKDNKFVKKMILLLIAFSIILIFNSYYRMYLYINAFGFTNLRLQVILFLAMELILFSILIKRIISKLKIKDSILFIFIPLSFYILNLYLCSDWFIKILNKLLIKLLN